MHPFSGVLIVVAAVSADGATSGWVNEKVMPKVEFVLKERDKTIKDSKLNSVPYVVRRQEGEWLLVGDRVSGWAHHSHVVRLPDAAKYYTDLLAKNPKSSLLLVRRAITYTETGEAQKAIADYSAALASDPKNSTAYNNRGALWAAGKEPSKALADFDEAIKLDPTFAQAYNNRGSLHLSQGKVDKAVADFDLAVKHDAKDARALYNRGNALEAAGEAKRAIEDYYAAMKLNPRDARPFNNVAWLRATNPQAELRNAKEAVELATRACTLTSEKDPETLDTLAAAHAEAGEFEKAQETLAKALPLMSEAGRKDCEARLALYKEKQPYRSEK